MEPRQGIDLAHFQAVSATTGRAPGGGGPEPEPAASAPSLPLVFLTGDEGKEEPRELPYNGHVDLNLALQEATRRGNLQAVKVLFEEQRRRMRDRRASSSSTGAVSAVEDMRVQLAEAWRGLGLSADDVLGAWGGEDKEDREGEGLAAAVKTMLRADDSRGALPSSTEDVAGTPRDSLSRATRLRSLSLDSVWTLLEAPLRQPSLSADGVLDVLCRLALAQRQGLLSQASRAFFKRALLREGAADDSGSAIIQHIHTVLSAIGAPAEPSVLEGGGGGSQVVAVGGEGEVEHEDLESDPLTADFHCPITHEIMIDPVTISCGHTFSRAALEQYLQQRSATAMAAQSTASCPECRLPVREAAEQLAVNKLLQRTITRLCGQRLEALALQEVQAMGQRFGPEAAPRLNELVDRYPDHQRIGRAALEVLSCWVLTCPPSSLSELTRGRTLKQLTRRLATAHRIADEGERLWVVETAFRILRALAGSSAAAMGGSLAVRQLVAVGVPQLAFAFLRDMQQQQQAAAVNTAADAAAAEELECRRRLGVLADVLAVVLAVLGAPGTACLTDWFGSSSSQPQPGEEDQRGGQDGPVVAECWLRPGSSFSSSPLDDDGPWGYLLPPAWARPVSDLCCRWASLLRFRQRHLAMARRARRQQQQPEQGIATSTSSSSSSSSSPDTTTQAEAKDDAEREEEEEEEEEALLCRAVLELWQAHPEHEELTRATLHVLAGLWDGREEEREKDEQGEGDGLRSLVVPEAVSSFVRDQCPALVECPHRSLDTRVLAGRLVLLWAVDGGRLRSEEAAAVAGPLADRLGQLLDYWSGRSAELEGLVSQQRQGGTGAGGGGGGQWDAAFEETSSSDVVLSADNPCRAQFRARGWALGPPLPPASLVTLRFRLERDKPSDQASCMGLWLSPDSLPGAQATYHDQGAALVLLRSFSGELYYRGRAVGKWPDMRVQPGQELTLAVDTSRGKVSFTNQHGRRVSKLFRGVGGAAGPGGGWSGCRPVVMSYGRGSPSVQPIVSVVACQLEPAPDKWPVGLVRLFGDCMEGQLREAGALTPMADCLLPPPIPVRTTITRPRQHGEAEDDDEEARRPLLSGQLERSSGGGGAAALPLLLPPPPAPPTSPEEDRSLTAALGEGGRPNSRRGKQQQQEGSSRRLEQLSVGGRPATWCFKLKRDATSTRQAASATTSQGGPSSEPEAFIGLLGYYQCCSQKQAGGCEDEPPPVPLLAFSLVVSSTGQLVLERPGHEPLACKVKGFGGRQHRLVRRQIQARLAPQASGPGRDPMMRRRSGWVAELELEVRSGSSTLWASSSTTHDQQQHHRLALALPPGGAAPLLLVRPFVAFAGHDSRRRSMSVSVSRPAASDERVADMTARLSTLRTASTAPDHARLNHGQQQQQQQCLVPLDESCVREWASSVVRSVVEPLRRQTRLSCVGAEGGGAALEEEEGGGARDSALVRSFGFDVNTIALLVQGSRRRHIWHLSCLVLPNAVPETVEVSRLYYAGDARRLLVFGATRGARDPRASLREGSTWDVVASRDVDLPPRAATTDSSTTTTEEGRSPSTTTALISAGPRPQFHVQTVELSPPLRVEAGAHLGIAARERGDLSIPGYRDPRFLRVPYWWASGLPDLQPQPPATGGGPALPRLRLEFDGEGDASQIAFGYDLIEPLPAATHSPEQAGPVRQEGVTDDDEDGSEPDATPPQAEGGEGGGADLDDSGGGADAAAAVAATMLLDPAMRRLRELDRVLGEALHTAAIRAVEEAQRRAAVAGGGRGAAGRQDRGAQAGGEGEDEEGQQQTTDLDQQQEEEEGNAARAGGPRRRDSPPNCPVS